MATAVAAVAQQTNPPSGLDFNAFKIVAERNIFNQSRLPHERALRQTRVADSFSLVGTLFYTGGDIAFFDGTSGQYRRALKAGEGIAGFTVTAITLNSVTLSDGTNRTVLKITSQMRRDGSGPWSVSDERTSYASTGSPVGSNQARYSDRSRRYGSGRSNFTSTGNQEEVLPSQGIEGSPPAAMENNPSAASISGEAGDALRRLMEQRAQEEQRLGQGQ